MSKTRFEGLSYRKDAPGLWRFVDEDGERSVGPQYPTKAELLADIEWFAGVFCSGRLRRLMGPADTRNRARAYRDAAAEIEREDHLKKGGSE